MELIKPYNKKYVGIDISEALNRKKTTYVHKKEVLKSAIDKIMSGDIELLSEKTFDNVCFVVLTFCSTYMVGQFLRFLWH